MNLKKLLDGINIDADWIGLRKVKETATYRAIRDNNPVSNHKDQSGPSVPRQNYPQTWA